MAVGAPEGCVSIWAADEPNLEAAHPPVRPNRNSKTYNVDWVDHNFDQIQKNQLCVSDGMNYSVFFSRVIDQ